MNILDKSKLRPQILDIMEDIEKVSLMATEEFLKKKENQGVDFHAIWKKVAMGNVRALKGDNMHGYMSKEEQIFLAKFFRHSVEYRSTYLQKYVSPISKDVVCTQVNADGVAAEWQSFPSAKNDTVFLYFHGGGYIMGSPNFRRLLTINLSKITNMRVLSVDYRLAPENPYPAGLEDCILVYKWLLSCGFKPNNIIIGGDSAGGYFTIMTLVNLRNDETPLPAGAVCLAPATDLTLKSESYFKNASTDPILSNLGIFWWAESFLAGKDPYSVSPLYVNLSGLPPILIQVSTSEMLFNDSTRFAERAKAAGVDITLQTWDDTLHVFQDFDLPESTEALVKIKEFVQRHISSINYS